MQVLESGDVTYVGLDEAIADGAIAVIPSEATTAHAQHGEHVILVLEPLVVGSSDGSSRRVWPGDLLSCDEIEHAGSALATLLSHHRVARMPVRGVIALGLAGSR